MKQGRTIVRLSYRTGIILYIVLYFIAASLYPGGNSFNEKTPGFSWRYNFWCNLLNETAINGEPNSGQLFAIAGLLVLSISLSLFFIAAPGALRLNEATRMAIRISGTTAMLSALLLASPLPHDLITNIASGLGLIAMGGLLLGLYRSGLRFLFVWALLNLFLVVLNNWFYLDPELIRDLPLVQKISFLSFLLWILVFP